MNIKMNLIAVVVAIMSLAVLVKCNPVDFLTQLTDESDRMLLKSFAEFFTSEYSDESSASSIPNGIRTRQDITSRQDNCRLPMKRGLCRALLPRWRWISFLAYIQTHLGYHVNVVVDKWKWNPRGNYAILPKININIIKKDLFPLSSYSTMTKISKIFLHFTMFYAMFHQI